MGPSPGLAAAVDGLLRRLLVASAGCVLDCGAVPGDEEGPGALGEAHALLLPGTPRSGVGKGGGKGVGQGTAPSTRPSSDGSDDGGFNEDDVDDDGEEVGDGEGDEGGGGGAWRATAPADAPHHAHHHPHAGRRPATAGAHRNVAGDGVDSPTRLLNLPLPAAAAPRRRRYGDAAATVATTAPTTSKSTGPSQTRARQEYATLADFDPNQLDFLLY